MSPAAPDSPGPTARRLLLTLEQLGYVRSVGGSFSLTTQVLRLGTAGIAAQGIWDVARPHLVNLVGHTGESSSMSQLDGSDIVYTARVPVPKIIALAVSIGTLFPAVATSMGRVLLADLARDDLEDVLATPSRSGIIPRLARCRGPNSTTTWPRSASAAGRCRTRCCHSASGRSPRRSANRDGRTVAAMNVTVHAAETSIETLTGEYLPFLLSTARAVTEEWSNLSRLPVATPAGVEADRKNNKN